MAHSPTNSAETFNELDPHGAEGHGQHASHVIVGPLTLRTILGVLLFFTALTVGLAQLEVAIQHAFDIVLPWWVNVAVAMSIAVVKAILVMAFFMQLKYDNPVNSMLMLVTFAALATFLFFTGLDLFSRGKLDPMKAPQITAGGTGSGVNGTGGKPVAVAAKERMLEYLTVKTFAQATAHELATASPTAARIIEESWREIELSGQRADSRARFLTYVKDRAANVDSATATLLAGLKLPEDPTKYEPALAAFAFIKADVAGHGHADHAHEVPMHSPNASRPRVGVTGALDASDPHAESGPDQGSRQGNGHAPESKAPARSNH